jgi:hypothetical protein
VTSRKIESSSPDVSARPISSHGATSALISAAGPRAFRMIETGRFSLVVGCASLLALSRRGEAVDAEGVFRGYAPAGDRSGGKWCVRARGSRTLRSEPRYGGDALTLKRDEIVMIDNLLAQRKLASSPMRLLYRSCTRGSFISESVKSARRCRSHGAAVKLIFPQVGISRPAGRSVQHESKPSKGAEVLVGG